MNRRLFLLGLCGGLTGCTTFDQYCRVKPLSPKKAFKCTVPLTSRRQR